MRTILIGILTLLIVSCHNPKSDKSEDLNSIRDLVNHAGFINIPWIYYSFSENVYDGNMPGIGEGNLWTFKDIPGEIAGVLPDTTNYFAIVYFDSINDWMPSISTFDKIGNKIESNPICIYRCARITEHIDSCIEKVIIDENLHFNMYSNLVMELKSGSDMGSLIKICSEIRQSGYIDEFGKFVFSEEEEDICD